MKYRVIDTRTGYDITDDFKWVITPDGELSYRFYGDLIGCPTAKAVPSVEDWNED